MLHLMPLLTLQSLSAFLPGIKPSRSWDMKASSKTDSSDYMEPLVSPANEYPKYLELIDGESPQCESQLGYSQPPLRQSYSKLDSVGDGNDTETSDLGGSGPPSERSSAHLQHDGSLSPQGPLPPRHPHRYYTQVSTDDHEDDESGYGAAACNSTDSRKAHKSQLNYAQLASSVISSDIDTDNEAICPPSPSYPPPCRPKVSASSEPWGKNNNSWNGQLETPASNSKRAKHTSSDSIC